MPAIVLDVSSDTDDERRSTHSYPSGDEIDFVEDVDDLLSSLLLGEVRLDGLASSSHGVTGVEDVEE